MYIQRHMIMWLLPITVALFLFGAGLAKWLSSAEKSDLSEVVIETKDSALADRKHIQKLLSQLKSDQRLPFSLQTGEQQWKGYFQGHTFELQGIIDGREWIMRRMDGSFEQRIDGVIQDSHTLPYSLFTPLEHAQLIYDQLNSLQPVSFKLDKNHQACYQLNVPAAGLKQQMASWLGPAFSEAEIADALQQMRIVYELWYEPEENRITQLTLSIFGKTPNGEKKQNEVIFRF